MSSFNPPRDRDAWSTIRGYVYQVDLTIKRWLDLVTPQILEIECGEDIDTIGRALIADSNERERLLEQVKHRNSSLTLKKPEAISAIANFIEHGQTNPATELFFLFTTNAKVGREQPSLLPNHIPAIEAWESLRLGESEERNRHGMLAGIRQILQNTKRPNNLNELTWQMFCDFRETTSDEQLFDLIRKFQWRTNAPEARSLKSILKKQLLDRQHAIDPLQAQEQYQRLFLYVFSRLCERGRKQLTIEELNAQISLPSLSSNDHARLEILRCWFDEIDVRVTDLEQEQQQSSKLFNRLSAQVQQLTSSYGIDRAINYVVETPILDVYPLIERASLRKETVQSLAKIFTNQTWMAIHGSLGSGKTQLVVLLVQYLTSQGHCTNCVWLRLRDLTVEQACLRFDRAIETLTSRPSNGNRSRWYSQLIDRLDVKTILVFDDLPRLERGDELETRLVQLARVCYGKGIRLLSTSFHQLPQNLQSILDGQILYKKQVPLFTNNEVADLFRAYDAPEVFLNSEWVNYLNALANFHPSLLTAIAEYLNSQNWQFTQETLTFLVQGDHLTGINEDTLRHILVSIHDDKSQELLYRLNLVLKDFSPEDMQALAEVAPSIERPRQRLNNLLGVWIQRDINNRLMVSPLVKALGSQDLSTSVRQECHLTLGDRIVCSGLNQYKALYAIRHFTMAKSFNKAGSVLLFALDRLEDCEAHIDDGGILSLWSQQPLSEQMDLGLRILIRGIQISIRVSHQKSVQYLLENLDNLMEQATIQESEVVIALVARLIKKCPNQVGFFRLNHYFRKALYFSSTARLPDGSALSLSPEVRFESLIWAISSNIQNPTELEDWISTLELLTSEQKQRAFSTSTTESDCLLVAKRLWVKETEKPEAEQDWQTILDATHNLAESSANLGLELLWASAISFEVIILAEFNKELNQAIEVAESAITRASDDSRVQFLLRFSLGQQFLFANRYDEAVASLTQALSQPTEAYPSSRLIALLRLSEAIAAQEPYLAIQYAQQAVNLARSSEEVSETKLVQALGELAIAKWLTMDLSAAFEIWDQAVEYLLKYRKDENIWKELFVLCAHCTGYFTTLAIKGHPPTENSVAPTRGIFLTRNPARIDRYDPLHDCLLPSLVAALAEALGQDAHALTWAMRGLEMTRKAQQTLPLISLGLTIIPQLVLENRNPEALDLAVEIEALLIKHYQLGHSESNTLELGVNIQEVLGSRENGPWRLAEGSALILGVLPTIFQIANISIYQPEQAKSQAMNLAEMCREISSMSESQTLWTTSAEIIEQIHLQQSTCVELINQYKNLSPPDMILTILGLMAATLQQNAPLIEVLRIHLSIIEKVQKLTNPQPTTWRKIILPYFFNYWKTSIERVMFRFKDPQLTAAMLYKSQDLPPDKQGQEILVIIKNALVM
jgi:HPt (histidine-containing phosphotransfer) domain-containing protein